MTIRSAHHRPENVFLDTGDGVFVMDNAQKCCLGSGVAPQTPISLYIMGPKMCLWIPGMEVFGMRDGKND